VYTMDIKRLRQLAGLITEDDTKDFEKVAFGDLRQSDEEDTEWENQVYMALRRFINSSTPVNKSTAERILQDVHALKNKYPNELVPDASVAYRGTQLSLDEYMDIIDIIGIDKINAKPDDYVFDIGERMYTPQSPIQSWTTNSRFAFSFAASGGIEEGPGWNQHFPFPAVMQANVDPTFIMSTDITNLVAVQSHGVGEDEIIRTASSPIKCQYRITARWLWQVNEENT
jgi:hypothetical protein